MSVEFKAQAILPTQFGEFDIHVFVHDNQEHLALTIGNIDKTDIVLTRIHSECLTGDGLFSLRCDCGPQLKYAMQKMSKAKAGLLIYLRQEGRGIGLLEKIKAYQLQDSGEDTHSANLKLGHLADQRNYNMVEGIFKKFRINGIDLMTNNPDKVKAVEKSGVKIHNRLPITAGHNDHNKKYLQTKKEKFNHWLN